MTNYIMLLIADLLLAVNFAINKIYQRRAGTSFRVGFVFSALSGIFTSAVFWIYNGFNFVVTPFSVLIAVLASAFGISNLIMGFRIMKWHSVSLYTLFLMTGGMTVPYVFGLVFLNESFSVLRLIGLIVIFFGIFLSGVGKEKIDKKTAALCAIVFLLNGCTSVVLKLHGINTELAVEPQEYVVLSGLVCFMVNLVLIATVRDNAEKTVTEEKIPAPAALLYGILPLLSAIASGASSVLQLEGAKTVDASVLYPLITGGSIIFTTLTGWLVFKEKLSRNMWIGILCTFVGTLLFLEF